MGQVALTINGRTYTIGCEDGEEDHLMDLARYLDKYVTSLTGSVGQVGDTRLLLMAGLMVADELSDKLSYVDDLESELEELRSGKPATKRASRQGDAVAVEMIEATAARIEAIAASLEHA
jgi:cell division protein ZapA